MGRAYCLHGLSKSTDNGWRKPSGKSGIHFEPVKIGVIKLYLHRVYVYNTVTLKWQYPFSPLV